MIETAAALADLEAIAATPGLDGLLVGPVDLALALGYGLSLDMPAEILDAVETIADVCRRRQLICASVSFGLDNAAQQLERGVGFLTSGSDAMFMRRGAEADLAALRGMAAGDR
jgi:4-hydroxy-2-oxoheptanedioate aldolase